MTNYDKYLQFCKDYGHLECGDFFKQLAFTFQVSLDTAYDLWYAPQRSWFKPEMFDEIIRLDKEVGFKPNYRTGEFDWNPVDNHFVPDIG